MPLYLKLLLLGFSVTSAKHIFNWYSLQDLIENPLSLTNSPVVLSLCPIPLHSRKQLMSYDELAGWLAGWVGLCLFCTVHSDLAHSGPSGHLRDLAIPPLLLPEACSHQKACGFTLAQVPLLAPSGFYSLSSVKDEVPAVRYHLASTFKFWAGDFFVSLVSPVAARGACSIEKAVHELSFKEAMERAMIDIYHSKLSEASACSKKDYWCASSE